VLNCPKSWELQYVERKERKTSVRPFQGIQVHRAVEAVLGTRLSTGVLPPMQMALDTFSDEFEKSKSMIEDWDEDGKGGTEGSAKDTGILCTRAYYEEAAAKATPIVVEKTFSTTVTTKDGKIHLPVLGRIDSIQVQTHTEQEYQDVREKVAAAGEDPTAALAAIIKPKKVVDLKVVTDKWSENDLANDLQFALYAGVEHVPDVQVDMVVKGRAKVPRPRYEQLSGVMTNREVSYAVEVAADVAKTIALGHFSRTTPDHWSCSPKYCSMWRHCRGK
jgi:hypothetical protein